MVSSAQILPVNMLLYFIVFIFQINYWNSSNEEEVMAKQNIIELKPGQNNLNKGLIIGLEPVTWYKFNVQLYSAAGNGPKSSTYSQQTLNRG